jgi:hypothetical protein
VRLIETGNMIYAESGALANLSKASSLCHAELGAPVDKFYKRFQMLKNLSRRVRCAFTQSRVRFLLKSRRVRCAFTQSQVRFYAESGAKTLIMSLILIYFLPALIDS